MAPIAGEFSCIYRLVRATSRRADLDRGTSIVLKSQSVRLFSIPINPDQGLSVIPVKNSLKEDLKAGVPDPILFRVSPRLVGTYVRVKTWYACGRHHVASVDPLELLSIDPSTISHKMAGGQQAFQQPDIVPEVLAGDWDFEIKELDAYDLHRGIVCRIRDGLKWEETAFYGRVQEQFSTGYYGRENQKWGCATFEEFEERLVQLDELWQTIDREGYRSQRELRQRTAVAPATRKIHRFYPPELHEVTINIGRNGELLFHEGRHRLAIAQALEVERIPVRVKTRHEQWQAKRDALAESHHAAVRPDTDHPDMRFAKPRR